MPSRKQHKLNDEKLKAVHRHSYLKEIMRLRDQQREDPRPRIGRQITRLEKKLRQYA